MATRLAKDMVTRYGMSDKLGARTFGEHEELIFLGREIHESKDYSEKTAEEIDREISQLIFEAQKRAREIVEQKRDKLEKLVTVLMEKETVEQEVLAEVLGPKTA